MGGAAGALHDGLRRPAGVRRHAEDAEEGESARFFVSLARRLGLYVAYGFPERRPSCGVSDSANLVGPRGVLLTYRKRQLVRTLGEPGVFVPGDGMPVVGAGGARVAIAICWDLGSPEAAREAAFGGRNSSWPRPAGGTRGEDSTSWRAPRALDNAVYVASANQLGDYPEAGFDTPGGVYGPDGMRAGARMDAGANGAGASAGGFAASVASVDTGFPERWRAAFGDTLEERQAGLAVPADVGGATIR